LMESGTAAAVEFADASGLIPSKNFTDGTSPLAAGLGDHGQGKKLWLSRAACFGCPIGCSQMGAVRTGRYKSFITDIVEYETAAMLGTNLDIGDPRAVAHLNRLCDELGLDTISAGACLGFAFEAVENGIIDPEPGIEMVFGSVAGAAAIIEQIALKKGALGKLLAKGVKAAAAEIGNGAGDIAMHVKGLEMPAWGPRGTPGMGLAYMTADRGACHQRGFPAGYEATGGMWEGKAVEALALEGKAALVYSLQNYLAGTDCLVKCDFGAMGVKPETYAIMLNAATGMNVDGSFFDMLGERVWNTTRMFNLREGMDTADETLPRRFVEEPLPSGPHKGHLISRSDMTYLLKDYYAIRGWDEKGHPTPETLTRTGVVMDKTFSL
jgi:aldehyde:ferredoxin oxidoreductase